MSNLTDELYPLPKRVNISLTTEEIEFLLEELEGDFADEESADLAERLTIRLINKRESEVATNMWYFNSYEVHQVYGGPEEGGWWYHLTECVGSQGFSISDTKGGLDELYKVVVKEFEGLEPNEEPPTFEEFIRNIQEFNQFAFRHGYDEYGEGTFLAVERAPAAQENMRRQHYE